MESVCYLNGKIIPLADARVGISDLGILRGFGIYEGITAFKGEPFHFSDHWKRFEDSARALGLALPLSEKEALEATRAVVLHNAHGVRAGVRMVLTGGETSDGLTHTKGSETFFITAEVAVPLPETVYKNGASLVTYEHQRFLPAFKTTNYITAVTLQPKRKAADAVEILFVAGGNALECATSNVFIVKNGTVITPKENVLPGITREITLELARGQHSTEERAVSTDELFNADEVFITSSFKDIVPVVEVDEKKIGSGAVGSITRDLMSRFATYANKQ